MRFFLLIISLIALSCSGSKPGGTSFGHAEWIDLTHAFDKNTLYWPNNVNGFELRTEAEGVTPGGYFYSSYSLCAPEHGGTHLDAPVHFAAGKLTADQLPLSSLTGEAIVVDISAAAGKNRDYLLSVADLEAWEKSMVAFRTSRLSWSVPAMDVSTRTGRSISVPAGKVHRPSPNSISPASIRLPRNGWLNGVRSKPWAWTHPA